MGSKKTIVLLIGFGVMVALYWLVGSGALGTGDQSFDATVPGPAGGDRSTPSTVATGSSGRAASATQQAARSKTPDVKQPNTSQAGSGVGTSQSVPTRPSNAPPLVLVNPGSVKPENVVTVSGQGFVPGEQVAVVVQGPNGVPTSGQGNATVDKDGNFYGVPITVTMGTPMGSYTVLASGEDSGLKAQATLRVAGGTPYANPSAYSGKGGSSVSFEGGGFRPGEVVSLHFDSLAVDPLQQVFAGSDGSVMLTGTVPLASPGEHAFLLVGNQSDTPVRVPFSVVAFSPWISPTQYSPTPAQMLGFAGHDFAPGEEVRLYRDEVSDHPIAVAHADENGEFQTPDVYEIPIDAVGKNLFLAIGLHSNTVVSTTLEVLPFNPVIELSTYAGNPGTVVTFKGTGYARNETITAYLGGPNGGREVVKFKAGEDGSFEGAGAFKIPPDISAGPVGISVVGEQSRIPLDLIFEVLPLTPWAGLTQHAGPAGSSTSFEGHGFLPGENVTIHLGDREAPTLATVQTDDKGNFYGGGKYTVPEGTEGKINFTMVGETSRIAASTSFTVTPNGGEQGAQPTPTPEQKTGEQ